MLDCWSIFCEQFFAINRLEMLVSHFVKAVIKNTPGARNKHQLCNEGERESVGPCDHLNMWPCFYNIIKSGLLCLQYVSTEQEALK